MDYLPHLVSLFFVILAVVYLYWGTSIIYTNSTVMMNRLFLLVCIAFSIWTFGFALSNSASTVESAFFWRRFSAIGWISVHSLTLHFLLFLTCPDCDQRKKQLFLLVYLPTFLCLYGFVFSGSLAASQNDLHKIAYGWINLSPDNGWNLFYNFYYISYAFASLSLVWRWQKHSKSKPLKKHANLIFFGSLTAILLGGLVDVIFAPWTRPFLPQVAPVFLLLPTWAMYYAIRYYHVMQPKKTEQSDLFLTAADQKNIFNKISLGFCLGGILAFLFEVLPHDHSGNGNLTAGLKSTFLLFSISLAIFLIQKIKTESHRDTLTILVLVLSIPLITFHFLAYSSLTVWIFPAIIMIASLIFSNRKLLISTTIMMLITQSLLWVFKPENTVTINYFDYLLRMMIIVFIFLVGFYVNRIYITNLKKSTNQIAFQTLSAHLSYEFVNLTQENFDKKINHLLKDMGSFFKVDRTYFFLINHDDSTMTYTHEWCNTGINPEVGTIEKIPLSVFPWWLGQLESRGMVYIKDVFQMPPEAKEEQDQLIRQEVKSLVSLPVYGDDQIQGFIGIDSVLAFKEWSNDHLEMLTILCNLIAQGLIKKKSDKEIEFMAYYDHLTGIPNRILFADRLNQALSRAKRKGTFTCTIFIDLDNFKAVNDTMGHHGGDDLLKAIAQILLAQVRKMDTVCRFGGDEFMIMLSDINHLEDIPPIAEKIMALFLKPFIINHQEFFITASAGVAISFIDGDDAETLIKNADLAMYQAKDKGKNQYALCTSDMKAEVQQNMMLANDLYRAIEREELIVYYQPQIDLQTKEINGVEALLRWQHPKHGMISPEIFIPLAEKSSLINGIGKWVLETACAQNKKWQDTGLASLSVAVNLSGTQFINAQIIDCVKDILAQTGLNPKYLELEITESIAIQDADYAITVLSALKELGVTIAIDDFGTEYSSLNRLKTLPLDRLKIDMQFIQGLEHSQKDQAITSGIIKLAKSLNLTVVAEGVETLPQLDFLDQEQCNFVQGYYYYKPMPAEALEEILGDLKNH